MSYPIVGAYHVVHEAKKEHLHFFDEIEQYWTFVRSLPEHELGHPAGAPLSAAQKPFTISLVAPADPTARLADGRHVGWDWHTEQSLLLIVAHSPFAEFPGHVEIDAGACFHADIGGHPMVVSFSINTDSQRHSAIVGGFLDPHTSVLAIASAPSVELRDDLLSCLSTIRVIRSDAGTP